MRQVIVKDSTSPQGYRPGLAFFHCFSLDHQELDNGPGHFPAAVIEWSDGSVEVVYAGSIEFILSEK